MKGEQSVSCFAETETHFLNLNCGEDFSLAVVFALISVELTVIRFFRRRGCWLTLATNHSQACERCVRRLTPQIRKRTLRLTGKSDHADVGRFAASRRNDLLYALIDVYEALSILAGRQGPYGTVLPGACSKTHPNSKRLAQYLRACAGLSSRQVSNVKRYCHGNRYG